MNYIIKDANDKKMIMFVITSVPSLPEGWTVIGPASEHPEDLAEIEGPKDIEAQIKAAHDSMSSDVLSQMAMVFGTNNADSASAYEKTWQLMKSDPTEWTLLDLEDDNGEALDTEAKVVAYANAKIQTVLDYGKYRMQRIQQFKNEKALILAGS